MTYITYLAHTNFSKIFSLELFLLVPGLLILGFWTSYTDLKFGKIKNIATLSGLSYFLVVNIILIASGIFESGLVLSNFGLASILSVVLWKMKLWSAGDAKLFIVFSLGLPLNFIPLVLLPFFPSFSLFFNSFFIIFLVYWIYLIPQLFKKEKRNQIFNLFSIKEFIWILALLLALQTVSIWILSIYPSLKSLSIFAIIMIGIFLAEKILKSNYKFVIYAFALINIATNFNLFFDLQYLIQLGVLFFIIFIFHLINKFNSSKLHPKESSFFAFAHFLFLGMIATFFLGGNLLFSIINLI